MNIATFDDMIAAARRAGPVPVAVAAAHDPEVLRAVERAQREGMVDATLVGDWPAMEAYAAQIAAAGSPEVGRVLSDDEW